MEAQGMVHPAGDPGDAPHQHPAHRGAELYYAIHLPALGFRPRLGGQARFYVVLFGLWILWEEKFRAKAVK